MSRGYRKLDWVTGWWSGQLQAGLDLDTFSINEGTQTILELLDQQDVQEHWDELTIVRVVGQYYLNYTKNSGSGIGIMHMRMMVENQANASQALLAHDPSDPVNAEQKFMWHKVHMMGDSTRNLAPDVHPEWSHLDVTVGRRVEETMVLSLRMAHVRYAANDDGFFTCAAWIRVLVGFS